MKRNDIWYLIVITLLVLFAFRGLVLNLSKNLVDWRDYASATWVVNQNINHIKTFDFGNLFNTSSFYPYSNTLFLSETFFTQSLIGIPFSILTQNPIEIFNLVFLTTLFLNAFSGYLLWKRLFEKSFTAFLGSLMTVFSPFFFTQLSHSQMLAYWPSFFAIFILFGKKENIKKEILTGVFLAIQFLASVYLAYFLITAIFIFYLSRFRFYRLSKIFLNILVIFGIFILIDGIFIKGFIDIQKQFEIKRSLGELITYSAHVTDYIFPSIAGILYKNPLVSKWLSFDQHRVGELASFAGFAMSITGILGMVRLTNLKEKISLEFLKSKDRLFFLLLFFTGLIFSFGPRINFNGTYDAIPLPYTLLVKYIPFFHNVRAPARWFFLMCLGLTYFSLGYINNLKNKLLLGGITILLILELVPSGNISSQSNYIFPQDPILRSVCSNKKTVIVEVPVTHFDAANNIAEGLSYIEKRQLASLYNKCIMVNGYTSYDLPTILELKDGIYNSALNSNEKDFYSLIKKSGATILSIHFDYVRPELTPGLKNITNLLIKNKKLLSLGNDVYEIK